MKDSVKIKAVNGGAHFEIKRELSETVSSTDIQNRLQSIDGEIEMLKEQLERLEQNRTIIVEAMNTGKGSGKTETESKLI
jgi:hypothetical protein